MIGVWFFLIITIVCWGTTPILEKIGLTSLKDIDPVVGLFIRSCATFPVLLTILITTGKISDVSKLPFKTIVLFLCSGVLAGLFGMWTYYKVLQLSSASKIVPLAAIYPLVTAILGLLLLKENVSVPRILGTIFIILGVFLVK